MSPLALQYDAHTPQLSWLQMHLVRILATKNKYLPLTNGVLPSLYTLCLFFLCC